MTAEKPIVCYLGPETSYTHQAALQAFPPENFEHLPVLTIKDVFDTTQSGRATHGVVPFENSTNGSVVFTLDHFADRDGRYGDLSVCAEAYLGVHHCLLGYAPPPGASGQAAATTTGEKEDGVVQPLASLAHVKRVYSHPQAWGQLDEPGGGAGQGDETGTSAAVSSALAAQVQNLEVLARNIEDRDDNTTRFFVLRKDGSGGEQGPAPPLASGGVADGTKKTKSLVSFTVPHTSPGALADVLDCFRAGGLNLTSINSRPSLQEPFQYVFFVEFEGHRYDDPEGRVKSVLEGISRVAQTWRWLGSWVNMRA
ncbi:hypothetical protein G7054_g10377 [Neopestalotiopsis clavispora]|nr:hypothetical protein G7054_g10377 [Neopestalotiopsis clavispora]